MSEESAHTSIPEWELSCGSMHAVISSSGASVRILRYQGKPLVRTFASGEHPPAATNIILAPWPNRTAEGRFSFRGVDYQLEITEPERDNAIHGFTVHRIFDFVTEECSATRCVCRTVLGPEPGWPWPLELLVIYTVTEERLFGEVRVRNCAEEVAPFALGVHAYLDPLGEALDRCEASVDVVAQQPLDDKLRPSGARIPASCSAVPMAGVQLDDAFLVDPTAREHRAIVLHRGVGVELVWEKRLGWVQMYTSPEPERYLAVEPMSAPPNALVSGEDLVLLDPGEEQSFSWSVAPVGVDQEMTSRK